MRLRRVPERLQRMRENDRAQDLAARDEQVEFSKIWRNAGSISRSIVISVSVA